MNIQQLPSPLSLELRTKYGSLVNLTGIPAEILVLTLVDSDTNKEKRGTGLFRILYPSMGRVQYEWSEEDLQQTGDYRLSIGHADGVAGPAEVYEFSLRE